MALAQAQMVGLHGADTRCGFIGRIQFDLLLCVCSTQMPGPVRLLRSTDMAVQSVEIWEDFGCKTYWKSRLQGILRKSLPSKSRPSNTRSRGKVNYLMTESFSTVKLIRVGSQTRSHWQALLINGIPCVYGHEQEEIRHSLHLQHNWPLFLLPSSIEVVHCTTERVTLPEREKDIGGRRLPKTANPGVAYDGLSIVR